MRVILAGFLLLISLPSFAEDMLMARSHQSFPETMSVLQAAISEQGYKLSRVQRVDIGLTAMGYDTDKYRVVFFGRKDEMDNLIARYPQLTAYLPLKISIFAEGEQTILATINPEFLSLLFPQEELKPVFTRWSSDIREIIETTAFN